LQVIVEAGADVVALQEVRHDDNFGPTASPGGAETKGGVAKGTSKGANQVSSRCAAGKPHQGSPKAPAPIDQPAPP
jgi:hypothetical protein